MTTKPITVAELLSLARELIADPARWWDGEVKGNNMAKNCALTALSRAAIKLDKGVSYDLISEAIKILAKQFPEYVQRPGKTTTIIAANSTLGHAAVLTAYDAAIAKAKIEAR